jgi:hypothetical protein
MNQIYEVRHEQTNTLLTTCIMRDLADYLASNRNALMQTAGRPDRFQVVAVDFGFEFN